MRAVWSFWTKPWAARTGWGWPTDKHHLLAWVLSVECARRHYPETSLITDDCGARMLIDGLGLRIEHVSTELDELRDHDPELWMTGKLRAYRAQAEPFVHLDTDVFLWNRLPERIENAPVFTQNPEPFHLGASHYHPDQLQRVMTRENHGWIPPEWEWALSFGDSQLGACCGILGGRDVEFVRYYADTALRLIEETRNRTGWLSLPNRGHFNTSVEQYHLVACADFHRQRPGSPFRDVEIRYLFDSWRSAFDPNLAAKFGFTHLLSDAKASSAVADRIERRVARDYPEHYERCLRCVAR